MTESDFIAALRTLPLHPGARDLRDDAAMLTPGGETLVLTHDMVAEGVHFLPDDPPGSVAWRLVASNLSDLAAKGATPVGILLGYTLSGDAAWNAEFIDGLRAVMEAHAVPLIGGDTVAARGPRTHGVTAIGRATAGATPGRSGGNAGDRLWVTGAIGDAGIGLSLRRGGIGEPAALIERYLYPVPRLAFGREVAAHVTAMMDVSDGLLIDASRLAEASGVAAALDLDAVPLSDALSRHAGDSRATRLAAVTAGDDYELLFAASPAAAPALYALADRHALRLSPIGTLAAGMGLSVHDHDGAVPLPASLGYLHRA